MTYIAYFHRCSDGAATDTDDTTASMKVGGLGFYSHGDQSLTHHHWVRQTISAGSFGVHCTEAAEAALKGVFRHPLSRVKHSEQNVTHAAITNYLCHDLLFRALTPTFIPTKVVQPKALTPGVFLPYRVKVAGHVQDLTLVAPFVSATAQCKFLHPDVRVSVVEILDLMCDKLGLPHTTVSYRRLQHLDWVIGQKFVRQDGEIFWSTTSDYSYGGARHDCVRLVQTEEVEVNDGSSIVKKVTAECCRLVAFWTVSGLSRLNLRFPDQFQQRTHDGGDKIHLMLVRYFEAHPSAVKRDSEHRPICPAPLCINHCLWRYARTVSDRKVLRNRDGSPSIPYLQQTHIFGHNPAEQNRNYVNECKAYYSFIYPDHILSRAHITELFRGKSCTTSGEFIETAIII